MGALLQMAVSARAERAALLPPDPLTVPAPTSPVDARCEWAGNEEATCRAGRCGFCFEPVCGEHATGEAAELVTACRGASHRACHDGGCTDRSCWTD